MGRLGLTPNGLTLIGFAHHRRRRRPASALQAWLVGGLVVFVGGVFDMFDGTLARATGQVSKLGAFMDSVFDRAARSSSSSASSPGCRRAGVADGARSLAAAAHGRGVHGQLHPGEVRGPRLLRRAWAWPRSGSCPARSAS